MRIYEDDDSYESGTGAVTRREFEQLKGEVIELMETVQMMNDIIKSMTSTKHECEPEHD